MKNLKFKSVLLRLKPWLYLSAGLWGALLAYFSTLVMWRIFTLNPMLSFSIGLALNGIFNFWFISTYHVAQSDEPEIYKPEISYLSFLFIHTILCGIGLLVMKLILVPTGVSPEVSVLIALVWLSLMSLFVGRIWIFVSPYDARVAYDELDGEFYEDSGDAASVGSFRAWYHEGRFDETQVRVTALYRPGAIVYDFGCGGSQWNKEGIPVIGIDANEALLKHGVKKKQLASFHVCKLEDTQLPSASADIIIITEVLEHIINPQKVLAEIQRVLKPGGHLVLSVPWDTIFSPFFWLFNAQCFYRGYVLGEKYYIARCGHVNHFSIKRLSHTLKNAGFEVQQMYRFRYLLLYSVSIRM